MEQSFGFGLAIGLMVGLGNEKLTRICLERLLRHEMLSMASLAPVIRLLVVGFYLLKFGALGVGLFWAFATFNFSVLGFAVGILAYQACRVITMLLAPHAYLSWRRM